MDEDFSRQTRRFSREAPQGGAFSAKPAAGGPTDGAVAESHVAGKRPDRRACCGCEYRFLVCVESGRLWLENFGGEEQIFCFLRQIRQNPVDCARKTRYYVKEQFFCEDVLP